MVSLMSVKSSVPSANANGQKKKENQQKASPLKITYLTSFFSTIFTYKHAAIATCTLVFVSLFVITHSTARVILYRFIH